MDRFFESLNRFSAYTGRELTTIFNLSTDLSLTIPTDSSWLEQSSWVRKGQGFKVTPRYRREFRFKKNLSIAVVYVFPICNHFTSAMRWIHEWMFSRLDINISDLFEIWQSIETPECIHVLLWRAWSSSTSNHRVLEMIKLLQFEQPFINR